MKTLYLIVLIAAFTACKKDISTQGPPGPQGSPATSPAGTITGNVSLYDDQKVHQTSNMDSVIVSIKGTTISALTDTTGRYTLREVPAGIHTMLFSKSGYGTYEQQQVSFPGNGKLFINVDLAETPKWKIIDFKITSTGMQIITNFTLTPYPTNREIVYIYGKNSDLDISNTSSFDGYFDLTVGSKTQGYGNWYYPFPYPSGSLFYLKVYPYTSNLHSYFDYETDKRVPVATGEPFNKVFPIVMQ